MRKPHERPELKLFVGGAATENVVELTSPIERQSPAQRLRRLLETLDEPLNALSHSQDKLQSSGNYNAIRLLQGMTHLRIFMGEYRGDIPAYANSLEEAFSSEVGGAGKAGAIVCAAGWNMLSEAFTSNLDCADKVGSKEFMSRYHSPTWKHLKVAGMPILQAATNAALELAQEACAINDTFPSRESSTFLTGSMAQCAAEYGGLSEEYIYNKALDEFGPAWRIWQSSGPRL